MLRCGFNQLRSAGNAIRRTDNALRREWNVQRRPEKAGSDMEKHTASHQEQAPHSSNHAWRFTEPSHVRRKAARIACHHLARRSVGMPRTNEELRLLRQPCADSPEHSPALSEEVCAGGKARRSRNDETQSSGLSGRVGIVSTVCVVASAHAHLASHHSAMN